MKKFCFLLFFQIAFRGLAQEFELYWNAEDCAGAYRTNYVIQGKKTFLGVDYWDVTVDSVRFEVNGLADSLYYVDRYDCYFTPIDTNDFSITAHVYYQGQSFDLTKNYKVFQVPVFQVDIVPFYEKDQLRHYKIRLLDSVTGQDITADYLICVSYFELKVRNKVVGSGFNHGYFIDVYTFPEIIKREFGKKEYFLLTGLLITPRHCSQSIWRETEIPMALH